MLTEGIVTRVEWNNLLRLCNIMNFPVLSRSQLFSNSKTRTSCRRGRCRKEKQEKSLWLQHQGQWVWHQEVCPWINLPCCIRVYHTAQWIADWVGILISQALRDQDETETKTQRQVLKCTEMTIFFQVPRNRCERWKSALTYREIGPRCAELTHGDKMDPSQSADLQQAVLCEKVFANARQKLSRPGEDQMLDVKVNVLIWWLLSGTMRATIRLGENYKENLFSYRSADFKAFKTLFDMTQKLMLNQTHEIKQFSTIEWNFTTGWDLLYKMTKFSYCRKQRNTFIQNPFSVWETCINSQNPQKSGKNIANSSRNPMFTKIIWNWQRTIWVRVEYCPRTRQWKLSKRFRQRWKPTE